MQRGQDALTEGMQSGETTLYLLQNAEAPDTQVQGLNFDSRP